jgi:hypothetical protein
MNRQQLYTAGFALLASIALTGCATTADQQGKIDQAATIACVSFEAADGFFNQLAKTPGTKITADQVALEGKIYAGVKSVCTPPYTTDVANLVKKATDAAAAIYALTRGA